MEPRTIPSHVGGRRASGSDEGTYLSEIIETLSDVAAIELDLKTIMQMVAERTQRLTGADGASVQIVAGDHLTCRAVSGIMAGNVGARLRLSSSLSGYAIRTGTYAYCEDSETDERVDRAFVNRNGIRSLIVVPIFHGSQAVGILNVSSGKRNAFRQRHISALRLMAGLVAAAMSHAAEFEAKKSLLAERTEALAALRRSEERFRSAFDHAAIGMALVGLDGRWLQVNHSVCEILGYAEHELLVRNFQSLTHPADLDADLAQARKLLGGEVREYQMVKRYIHRQGHLVWVLLSVSLVWDADGNPLHFISQLQDITRRKQAEDALRASEEEYRATFDQAGVGKAQVDLHTGRLIRVNGKLCELLGYSADELLTKTFSEITHVDDVPVSHKTAAQMLSGAVRTYSVEKRYVRRDGRILWAILNATVINDSEGRPIRVVSTILDVTERKRAECLERDRRRVLEMVAKDMPLPEVLGQLAVAMEQQLPGSAAAVMVLQDGSVQLHGPSLPQKLRAALQSRALTLLAGLAAGTWETTDGCGVTFVGQDEIWNELRPFATAHDIVGCWATPVRATDSAPLGLLTVFCRESVRPTTPQVQTLDMAAKLAAICIEHHNTTRQLSHLVRHDSLTGLANRLMFHDRLQHAIDLARRRGDSVGVVLLDVDKFKSINDTFGHDTGDHLLQHFAQRLEGRLRDTDTMARLGGDEFAIVLPCLNSPDAAAVVAEKLLKSMTDPFELGDRSISATTSIGIAVYPDDAADAVALLKKADDALYRAKASGRNRYSR